VLAVVAGCLTWSAVARATTMHWPVTGGGTLSADFTIRTFQCSPGRTGLVRVQRYTSFSYTADTVTNPGVIAEFNTTIDPNCQGHPTYEIPLASGCVIQLDESLHPLLVCTGIPGYVGPRYLVVGVSYAPPGPSSFAQYATSASFGTTTSLSDSFSSSTSVEVSLTRGFNLAGCIDGERTMTTSTGVTQSSTSSSSTTISVQNLFTTRLSGTPNAFSPVNHDYDLVWLWLNPVVLLSVTPAPPGFPSSVTWEGYGYDLADQPAVDIWPIEVGYLNGHFGPLPFQDASVLARTWASSQVFPPGQGPGLTASDFVDILRADPFATPGYAVSLDFSTSPLSTTDRRFTISGASNGAVQSFVYRQPAPGGVPVTQSLTNTYSDSSTVASSTSYQTQVKFGVSASLTFKKFLLKFQASLKVEHTLNQTHMRGSSVTSTSSQINTLSITGPPCGSSTPPCVPAYTGPSQFDVYQDNIFGSFMFNPVH
jgi:hypothetical protein